MEMIRFVLALVFLLAGMVMFFSATFGVNRFEGALNRIHAAALGDTLGLLLSMIGLVIYRGFSFVSLKLLVIVVFFWLASPVVSHMLGRFEMETNPDPGQLLRRDAVSETEAGDPKMEKEEK